MTYYFEERQNRYHVVFESLAYKLFDPFLQVEGISFDDLINQAIDDFILSGENQSFSGNVYELTLTDEATIIEDKLSGATEQMPTDLFIEVFEDWLECCYA